LIKKLERKTSALGEANCDLIESTKELSSSNQQLRASEQQLKASNQQLELILKTTNINIDIIDPEFNLLYVDSEWQKIYGSPEGKKCFKYFANRDEMCLGCGIPKALKTKKNVLTEELLPKEATGL